MKFDHSQAAPKMGRAAWASVLVALSLVVAKGFVWLASGSVALLGSWLDSLLDLMASLVNLIAIRTAVEPPDKEHRFGHGKAEAIAGLFQCSLILVSALFLLVASISHLLKGEALLRGDWAIGVSVLAIVLTLGLVAYQRHVVAATGSVAIEADSLHYTGDLMLNLAVIAAVALSTFAGVLWADGLFGIGIALYLGYTATGIFRKSVDMLMDREFMEEEREQIFNLVMGNADVMGLHDMKTRCSGLTSFIQMHIELEGDLSLHQAHLIADEVETSYLYLETAEKTVVPDPVGQQVAKPRNTLRTVVIRTRDTDLTGEVEVPVNALGAIGDSIGINNTCRRMTPAKVQADLMRSVKQPAPTNEPGDDVGDGQRTFDDGGQFLANSDVFPVTRGGAAHDLGIIHGFDAGYVLRAIPGPFDAMILPLLACGIALGTDTEGTGGGDHDAVLVGERTVVGL